MKKYQICKVLCDLVPYKRADLDLSPRAAEATQKTYFLLDETFISLQNFDIFSKIGFIFSLEFTKNTFHEIILLEASQTVCLWNFKNVQ